MSTIRIITDSTADLGRALAQAHQVRQVPLLVQFDREEYKDGIDMDSDRLFQMVGVRKQLPKTASPSPAAFRQAFAEATADGSQALYIGLSTQFSATVQNARLAAEAFPAGQVQVFDSANLSTGIGLLVLYACDLVQQGNGMEEVLAALEAARPKVRTAFVIDTLDYLYKGGRCSGVQALVGGLLRIRPIISVADGGMVVATKVRGPRHKALDWMLDGFARDAQQGLVRPERVFVTHTGVPEDARYLADAVRRLMPEVQEVLETRAGSVIGSHCGPGTIGLLYMTK